MKSKEIIDFIGEFFSTWLNEINKGIASGEIKIPYKYTFTNFIRIAESPDHYIWELSGSKKIQPGQYVKISMPNTIEKICNATSFFIPGPRLKKEINSGIKISAENNSFSNLRFATEYDIKIIKNLLNIDKILTTLTPVKGDIPLLIEPKANYILFLNVEIIRSGGLNLYYRVIPSAFLIKKEIKREQLIQWLEKQLKYSFLNFPITGSIIGINNIIDTSIEHFSKQLISLSNQTINELIIDKFVRDNQEYFVKALGYNAALHQKNLIWKQRDNEDPYRSTPDYLMKRKDGNYDILDLKTGAIQSKSITKHKKVGTDGKGKARVRFGSYVTELIAQLKDYNKYFQFEKNREWALKKYGIKIDNPKLIGIVGNYNNFDKTEVSSALECYKDNICILSYLDVVNLLKGQFKM